MMISERIQAVIHKLEVGGGARWLQYLMVAVAVLALAFFYDIRAYRGFASPEAMDMAQVARNLEKGRGFSTDFIRPFSLYLVQKHNRAAHPEEILATNAMDFAQIDRPHPDLANAPVYPVVLAGLMKIWPPDWQVQTQKPFWSEGGRFMRYQPEFRIAIFNQFLLLAVVVLTFLLAKRFFDGQAAWLAALLTLGSDLLWKFSVSGLSTVLVLVIFLGLVACLAKTEELGRAGPPNARLLVFAVAAGLLTGLGMLTRYSFGWLIVPVVVFLTFFCGASRPRLAAAASVAFALVVSPWMARNLAVSGTFFGTAGYAMAEDTSVFAGSRLMQSLNPDLSSAYGIAPYAHKFWQNLSSIFQGDLPRIGGTWVGILFFAGLLLGLRNVTARRIRYFTMLCLGVLVIVQALGKTSLSTISPELNSENQLVLLTPLAAIFGAAFFLTLLNQMKVPSLRTGYGVIALLVLLACQPLATALLSKTSPPSFPPYFPPDIQRVAGWMHEDELMMSDVPWAVAWYGDRQCAWTTLNSQSEFYALNDYLKRVQALYLSMNTLNGRLITECMQGGADGWNRFVLKAITANQYPNGFPLMPFTSSEPQLQSPGLFLTDRPRWPSE